MSEAHDTDRTLGDVARYGTIASVDLAAGRITVSAGDLTSGPIPWLAGSAGAGMRTWSPPSVGEQVLMLCPEGEIAAGVALTGVFSDAHPAPAGDDAHSVHFGDGTVIRYDPAAHHLSVVIAAGGTVAIDAPGGVTITGDVAITGNVTVSGTIDATGDVHGNGTSLHTHKHILVKTGTDQSGVPA